MKVVAVVCEYNPFHLGHAYQLGAIREAFGEDTAVIAVMSGNYVQRGEVAILGKFERARAAVDAGVSLVLELPFPFSVGAAEFFARAAVSLIDALGVVDVLSFGSECGDIALLQSIAQKAAAPAFREHLLAHIQSREQRATGYARAYAEAYTAFYGEDAGEIFSLPNNILSISYLSALQQINSPILPHTVLRRGTDADEVGEGVYAGASVLRERLLAGDTEGALLHLPKETHALWRDAIACGRAPASADALSAAFLSHLRLSNGKREARCAECGGGLYAHLARSAKEASDYSDLLALAATKKFTTARIRRALLYSFFGVTPSALRQKPRYTQVLAMDEKGQSILAHIRKSANISVLTKPADLHKLSAAARRQAELSYRADSVYTLACPKPPRADIFLRTAPYRR